MANGQDPLAVANGPLNAQIAGALQRVPRVPQANLLPPIRLMPSHVPAPPVPTPAAVATSPTDGASIAVRIPNVGTVRFPASMSMDDISKESERLANGGVTPTETPSLVNRAIPMAMRVGGAVLGGGVGAIAGPPGMMALGAGGAGLGEIAAQDYEIRTGQRQAPNPTQAVVQTALGAIPAGRAAGTTAAQIAAYRAGQGALMGGGATAATNLAETGELPTARQLATGTVLGGLLGGAFGRVEGRVRGARPTAIPPPEVGAIVEHPELGRVQVVAATGAGVQVTRGGGRRWTVPADSLTPAAELQGLPAGARFAATADGTVAPIGTDIPQPRAADGTFTRVTPAASYFDESGRQVFVGDPAAQSVPRPVRGALPPGRTPIVTEPPPPTPDPSGGRGVRAAVGSFDAQGRPVYLSDPDAQTVTRPVRGSLGPGPRFIATAEGAIASTDDPGRLEGLTAARGRATAPQAGDIISGRRVRSTFGLNPLQAVEQGLVVVQRNDKGEAIGYRLLPPDTSGGRAVPAAAVAYNVDPHVTAKEGITVAQYSSDPSASAAPVMSAEDRRWLEAMSADLEALTPQRGRLVWNEQRTEQEYVHGVRGSYVGEDIRAISGRRVGNTEIHQAIEDLLEGRTPTTRLHTAVLDAARGYAEKRAGYQGPSIKPGSEWIRRRTPRPADLPPFTARRLSRLSPDELRVQDRAAQDVEQHLDEYVETYRRVYGRVLNADNASELFDDYSTSAATRSANARAVRGPAASLVDEMYARVLTEPVPEGLERVVYFTSGGNGSGKSTLLGAGNRAAVALDSTLSDFAPSKAKIDQALAAGFDVNIAHVSRDPVESFRAVLTRAGEDVETGRPVPIGIHARTHLESPRVLAQLASTYADNPRVLIQAFQNTADGADLAPVRLDAIFAREYPEGDDLLTQLRAVLDDEYAAGRVEPALFRAIAGQDPPGAGRGSERDISRVGGAVRHDAPPEGRQASRQEVGGGTAPPAAIDDFEKFSSIFDDDVTPRAGGREPGEEGFISPILAARLGGAAGGAAVGAATGETPQERIENAVLFGLGGAAAPSLLAKGGGKSPRAVAQQLRSEGLQPNTPAWTRRWAQVVSPSSRSGRPIEDPMKGVDVFLDKFRNPLVKAGVRERLVENAGYAEQRRGVIDSKTLGKFANEVRINVQRTLPKGTALNAEQITAYARALQETQRRVNDLAAKVTSGAATDADVLALHAAKADADVVSKSLMGARAEAGRALGAFNLYQSVLETGNVNLIRDTLRAPWLRKEAERIASELAKLPNDPLVRYNWLRNQQSATLMDKARSVYYANILSGVKTHERNILGNIANLSAALVTQPVAAGMDVVRSAVKGTPRTITFDELPSNVAGAIAGIERGFQDAWFTARHGVNPARLKRTVAGATDGSKFDLPRVEFAGGGGNPFNWPGRALDSGDAFFRTTARSIELYGLAHTQAKNEGLKGQRFIDRVAELKAGLTPEGQAVRQQAEIFATRAVFQETPGPIVRGYQSWVRSVPALSLVTPFVKTPGAIMRQGLEFSPAGAFMKAARQGGRAGAQAQARVALGTAATGYLFWLAATDRLSGNGPSDPTTRNALMEAGWRPNSVKIADRWVSFQLMQPVSVQAAAVGNAVEAWREAGADPKAGPDVVARTIAKFAGSFLDQSFLSGLFDVVEALNEPEWAAERYAGRLASSAIPFTGAVRTVQQGMDPVVRRPEGIKETVESGIPTLSERVPARIGRFGQEVTREGGPIRRAADPFNVSSEQTDSVALEIDRLGVRLGVPVGRLQVDGENLSRTQSQELKTLQGQAIRTALERLVSGRGYARGSDEQKKEWVEREIRRARADVNEAYRQRVARERRRPAS